MNLNELKEILRLLDEKDIAEFELEEEGIKLRIKKAGSTNHAAPVPLVASGVPVVTPAAPATAAAAAPPEAAAAPPAGRPASAEEEGLVAVKSPIVGTFYRAADANAQPFVNVGDRVKPGQVLCIIEAMKLMNEIEAEVAGEIVKVHPENGQPVQYGESLFSIRAAP